LYKRDVAIPVAFRPRGVIHPGAMEQPARRLLPEPPLDERIEHFWSVAWDLRGRPPRQAETLPHPTVHVVFERDRSGIAGPHTRRFVRALEERGCVFGIKLRAGCGRALLGRPVAELADRVLPLAEGLGEEARALEERVLAAIERDAGGAGEGALLAAKLCEELLRVRLPPLEAEARRARDLAALAQRDVSLLRAESLAAAAGLSLHALQRLFRVHVGVSPKAVLLRYRLHEALLRLDADERVDLAGLAQDLGYHDQAHFGRDFKRLVGRAPGEYRRQ
jgi:AraC-like DNA-binding protein